MDGCLAQLQAPHGPPGCSTPTLPATVETALSAWQGFVDQPPFCCLLPAVSRQARQGSVAIGLQIRLVRPEKGSTCVRESRAFAEFWRRPVPHCKPYCAPLYASGRVGPSHYHQPCLGRLVASLMDPGVSTGRQRLWGV